MPQKYIVLQCVHCSLALAKRLLGGIWLSLFLMLAWTTSGHSNTHVHYRNTATITLYAEAFICNHSQYCKPAIMQAITHSG